VHAVAFFRYVYEPVCGFIGFHARCRGFLIQSVRMPRPPDHRQNRCFERWWQTASIQLSRFSSSSAVIGGQSIGSAFGAPASANCGVSMGICEFAEVRLRGRSGRQRSPTSSSPSLERLFQRWRKWRSVSREEDPAKRNKFAEASPHPCLCLAHRLRRFLRRRFLKCLFSFGNLQPVRVLPRPLPHKSRIRCGISSFWAVHA